MVVLLHGHRGGHILYSLCQIEATSTFGVSKNLTLLPENVSSLTQVVFLSCLFLKTSLTHNVLTEN